MMLIDNLKDINSSADLFKYICTLEEQLEVKTKQISYFLRELDRKDILVKRFAEEAGYKSIYEESPPQGKLLKVYITKARADGNAIGQFTTARYTESESFIFTENYFGWSVIYWKELN